MPRVWEALYDGLIPGSCKRRSQDTAAPDRAVRGLEDGKRNELTRQAARAAVGREDLPKLGQIFMGEKGSVSAENLK